MNLTFESEIRPGRTSMQEKREEYLGLKNLGRVWDSSWLRVLDRKLLGLNGLLLAATDLACLLLHVRQWETGSLGKIPAGFSHQYTSLWVLITSSIPWPTNCSLNTKFLILLIIVSFVFVGITSCKLHEPSK